MGYSASHLFTSLSFFSLFSSDFFRYSDNNFISKTTTTCYGEATINSRQKEELRRVMHTFKKLGSRVRFRDLGGGNNSG